VHRIIRKPSPALVVAMVALFAALGGYAAAATAVPLAKRALKADTAKNALVAENAKKLSGRTLQDLLGSAAKTAEGIAQDAAAGAVEQPGPASTVAGLITVKTAPWSIGPGQQSDTTVACDAGQKAISGGWEDPTGWGHAWDSRPSTDGSSWRTFISVSTQAPGVQSGTLYVVCVK